MRKVERGGWQRPVPRKRLLRLGRQAQIFIHPWWLRGCWSPSGVQSGVPLLAQRRSCSVAEIVQCRQRLTEVLFLSVQYRYRNPIMGTKEKNSKTGKEQNDNGIQKFFNKCSQSVSMYCKRTYLPSNSSAMPQLHFKRTLTTDNE